MLLLVFRLSSACCQRSGASPADFHAGCTLQSRRRFAGRQGKIQVAHAPRPSWGKASKAEKPARLARNRSVEGQKRRSVEASTSKAAMPVSSVGQQDSILDAAVQNRRLAIDSRVEESSALARAAEATGQASTRSSLHHHNTHRPPPPPNLAPLPWSPPTGPSNIIISPSLQFPPPPLTLPSTHCHLPSSSAFCALPHLIFDFYSFSCL